MYERWPDVADWALLVFAPRQRVSNAMKIELDQVHLSLEVLDGFFTSGETTLYNHGTMDATMSISSLPPWFTLLTALEEEHKLIVWGPSQSALHG